MAHHPDNLASPPADKLQRDRCPLCGQPNECRLCGPHLPATPCWCTHFSFPKELVARVPVGLVNQACICRRCVTAFQPEQKATG
jgi:hypothetical protein